MVVTLRAVRVLLPWGVLTEPQGRADRKGSLWEPFLLGLKGVTKEVRSPYCSVSQGRCTEFF